MKIKASIIFAFIGVVLVPAVSATLNEVTIPGFPGGEHASLNVFERHLENGTLATGTRAYSFSAADCAWPSTKTFADPIVKVSLNYVATNELYGTRGTLYHRVADTYTPVKNVTTFITALTDKYVAYGPTLSNILTGTSQSAPTGVPNPPSGFVLGQTSAFIAGIGAKNDMAVGYEVFWYSSASLGTAQSEMRGVIWNINGAGQMTIRAELPNHAVYSLDESETHALVDYQQEGQEVHNSIYTLNGGFYTSLSDDGTEPAYFLSIADNLDVVRNEWYNPGGQFNQPGGYYNRTTQLNVEAPYAGFSQFSGLSIVAVEDQHVAAISAKYACGSTGGGGTIATGDSLASIVAAGGARSAAIVGGGGVSILGAVAAAIGKKNLVKPALWSLAVGGAAAIGAYAFG